MASLGPELDKHCEIINQSSVIENGPPTRYLVKQRIDSQSKPFRKITSGDRDRNKSHKTILMVGETGTGKTTLINVMINYMLGVQREDKVWFEITDDQSDRTSAHSQTSIITVYEFYLQESPIDLTIIDTPGYGDTHAENEKEIVMSLLKLSKSAETIHEIDAVCLVITASQTRLSEKQIYIFDAIQSLFGRDIAENIVLLFTHSTGAPPKDTLTAVKEAKIKCAVNDENQPVYFLFDNCQPPVTNDEGDEMQISGDEMKWNLRLKGMDGFFKFLENIKPKTLQMTQNVLQQREQLQANISKIQSYIQVLNNENDTGPSVSRVVTCFTIFCYYLFCCRVRNNNYCTECTDISYYEEHINEAPINETTAEKRQFKESRDSESVVKKELQELEKEKIKKVMEAFSCVDALEMIALNTDSLNTLQHVDFLIEMLQEINEPEKAEILENIKKRAGEDKHRALEYMKRCIK